MNPNYVTLPNGKVVTVDQDGFIRVRVHVNLETLIANDREGFLDVLSEEATGSEVMGDISYTVVGQTGNTLQIEVCGLIDGMEAREVVYEALPQREFEVNVTRVGYGTRSVRLSAKTEQDAIEMADDDAGNHTYSEHASDYVIEAAAV